MNNTIENIQEENPEVYTVKEIAKKLRMSERGAYNFAKTTNEFKVLHAGKLIRINKESFDIWLNGGKAD